MCAEEEKDNYGFSVERSKNKRFELMREFYRQASEIQELLDKINGKEKQVYSFEELDKFDLNIMQNINSKLAIKKIYSTEKRLIFEVLMMKGGIFSLHFHKNCSEINYVESGTILERVKNVDYKQGETFIFLTGQDHELIALENSFLQVTVLKD